MSVDGERLVSKGGDFGDEDMTTFGSCSEEAPNKK